MDGGLLGRLACTRTTGRDLSAYPCGPVEQAATVRQRKSVPSPLVVPDLTEHIGEELSVPHSSRIDSSVAILCILLRVLAGARPRLNRQTHLHFGVSRHGETVEAIGDNSNAGHDEERCAGGLGPE